MAAGRCGKLPDEEQEERGVKTGGERRERSKGRRREERRESGTRP